MPWRELLYTITGVFFIGVASIERIHETFFARKGQRRGAIIARWSIVPLTIVHVSIWLLASLQWLYLQTKLNLIVAGSGVSLWIAAFIVRHWAIKTLGPYDSPHIQFCEQHQLVSTGPYSWVRHPRYLATFVEIPSFCLALNAYSAAFLSILLYYPLLILRISLEEKALAEYFGPRYAEYRQRIPALLPKLQLIRSK